MQWQEMRKDPDVFVLGEEVAEYQGAYKVTQGCYKNLVLAVWWIPHLKWGFGWRGGDFMGLKPIVEFMTFNFHAGH